MPDTAKLRVGFLLMHNFTLTAFASFVDVLRLAADKGDRSRPIDCSWQVMSPSRRQAKASCGIVVQASSGLIAPAALDYIVVVGGLLQGMPPLPREIGTYLRQAADAGVTLIGVCTGSFVLCRLGLMKQRKCCVSWYHYRDFVEEFPGLVPIADRLFVVDRKRITCSGGTGVADLAAQLVSERLGPSVAQKALHILLVDRRRFDGSAQPPPLLQTDSDDIRVSRALLLMEQNLAEPLPIMRIASQIGVSVRQLERVFAQQLKSTPHESYLALRLRHGHWMLKNNDLSTSRIAAELGFSDASHFGRSFKSRYGVTPAAFRKLAKKDEPNFPTSRRTREDASGPRVFD
jgi:transcriptional regulator GlxA family with amidase domain